MKRVRGLPDLSHMGHSSSEKTYTDSDSTSTHKMGPEDKEDEAGAQGETQEGGETTVSKTDLASIISQNTINNYARVHGLKYYAGRHEKDPNDPTKTCLQSISLSLAPWSLNPQLLYNFWVATVYSLLVSLGAINEPL